MSITVQRWLSKSICSLMLFRGLTFLYVELVGPASPAMLGPDHSVLLSYFHIFSSMFAGSTILLENRVSVCLRFVADHGPNDDVFQ